MKNQYTFTFNVTKNQIDLLNHVNNVVYVHWILDAAQKHWTYLSSEIMNSKYVWVVLRHEIDYLAPAKFNDKIQINTWVEKTIGAKSIRTVEIFKGEKLLVKSKTTWCLLDKQTMKPLRIPAEIMELFS